MVATVVALVKVCEEVASPAGRRLPKEDAEGYEQVNAAGAFVRLVLAIRCMDSSENPPLSVDAQKRSKV